MRYLDLNGLKSLIRWLKGELHEHTNKNALDKITEAKVKAWDSASGSKAFSIQDLEASGEYPKMTSIQKGEKKITVLYGDYEAPYAKVLIFYGEPNRLIKYEVCEKEGHYEKVTLQKMDFGGSYLLGEQREKISPEEISS